LRGYWSNTKLSDITWKDSSGGGGSRTLKMTNATGEDPKAVAFHARRGSVLYGPGEKITKSAAKLFAQYDIGPRHLASGYDWFIEEWCGITIGKS